MSETKTEVSETPKQKGNSLPKKKREHKLVAQEISYPPMGYESAGEYLLYRSETPKKD